MAFSMTDDEMKTRIRNGTPIQILADLNGCSAQAIYNWMKKNGITRPGKTEETFEETRTMSKSDLGVLEQIQEIEAGIQNEINRIEEDLRVLKDRSDSWRKVREAFLKCPD